MKQFLYIVSVLILFCSCASNSSKKAHTQQIRVFPNIQLPSLITNQEDANEYFVAHFFDKFIDTINVYRCDTNYVAGVSKAELEQAFANYCAILDRVPLAKARKGISRLYERIEACEKADTSSNLFEGMVDIVERYLYDPNSPLRNEDYYQPFVQKKSQSIYFKDYERDRFARESQMCSLNCVGTKAADFCFSDAKGRKYNLHSIKAERIILFFSNPGCHACKDIIEQIKSIPGIDEAIAKKEIAVLNIYIDEELENWYEYMPIYPKNWYNAYDPNYVIRTEILYDVRAIPSLYLLNSEKIVLMKDAPQDKILNAVYQYLQTAQ